MSDLEKGGSAEGPAGQNGGPQSPLSAPAHTIDGIEVYKAFETDPKLGLCHDKIPGLQEKWGPNQLKPPPKPNFFKIMVVSCVDIKRFCPNIAADRCASSW